MLQQAPRIGLIVVAVCFLVQGRIVAPDKTAYGCAGGMGAGCGGGIGYSGGGNSGGYGFGGYTGCGGYSVRSAAPLSAGYLSAMRVDPWQPLVKTHEPGPASVLLTVDVPADAKVFINDRPTKSTGQRRAYTSAGLKPAVVYPYRVRAEFVVEGKPVRIEKVVPLTAGKSATLAFTAATTSQVADTAPDDQGPSG